MTDCLCCCCCYAPVVYTTLHFFPSPLLLLAPQIPPFVWAAAASLLLLLPSLSVAPGHSTLLSLESPRSVARWRLCQEREKKELTVEGGAMISPSGSFSQ